MTKTERIQAALANEAPDCVPVSLWYHFNLADPAGRSLAEAELEFARKYDVDFIKVMHDVAYDLPPGLHFLEKPEDWRRLEPLNPERGGFGRQLEALSLIVADAPEGAPVIDTVFNTLAQTERLCGNKTLEHLAADADSVKAGLEAITASLAAFAEAAVNVGCAGVFLAQQGASFSVMSERQYRETFLRHDRRVLEGARQGWFNMLHAHGINIMFDLALELPMHVVNWSDRTTPPTLAEARGLFAGCLCGGVNETIIHDLKPAEVRQQVADAIEQTEGRRLILGPGCAVPTDTPEKNLKAMVETARNP